MTTSSISEPKTENTQSIEPLMDRRASSPRLDASSPTTSSIFTFPTLSLINDRSALADPHKRDITKSVEAKRVDDSLTSLGDETATEQDSTSMTIRSSLDSTPTSLPSTSTSIAVSTQENSEAPSIEQQNSTSYVLNGMHNCHKITSNRSRRASHRQQHQQETDVREMDISVLEGYDAEDNEPNAITTPTSISPTASSSFEHSVIANVDVDMSMTSPIRNTKSPPTSTSSSMSTGRRKIAESSMILSAGTLPAARSITAGGSLSPAWSMTSIPRDISAPYNQSHQERELPSSDPADEKLYSLVDRYGFLVEEGRTPIVDRNSTHEYPPSSSQRSVRSANGSRTPVKVIEKEQERSLKWARMAKQYTSEAKETEYSFPNNSKFIRRIYKGIPDCWRAAAWSDIIAKRSANFEPNIRQIYHNMLNISSPEEEQIDLDIPRTMHGHIMFRTRYGPGQCSLFNVLKAYSNYNNQVGYCQGMASIVATMLTFFDEEKTFVLLVQIFERYNINNLVVPGFPALFEAFFIQEELTKIYAPKVFESLQTMGIATPSYASRWYITLYSAGVVPYRTLLRIWDIFLLEGFDWLYFMALALLKYHESSLVLNNFEQTMEMLNAKMDIQDDDRLLRIARKLFKQARKTGIVAKLKETYATNNITL